MIAKPDLVLGFSYKFIYGFYNKIYFALILILSLINHKHIREGITITVVIIKNVPQSPFNQSTNAPDEEARVVLPAVPIDAKAHTELLYMFDLLEVK